MHKTAFHTLLILLSLLILSACGKDDPEKIAEEDRKKILSYIEKHDLDAQEYVTDRGEWLYYVIERTGDGRHPTLTTPIRMSYIGSLRDGTIFDYKSNVVMHLQNTILGWQYGIPLLEGGGKGMLLLPSALGYGPYPQYGIPANSVLIFEIEIIEF
jgi:FKBP-type peptidyl-prolyl cis-trans isomerase FkpA